MENLWGFYVLPVAPPLTMTHTHTHTHPAGPGGVEVHPGPFENRVASAGYEGEGADDNVCFFFLPQVQKLIRMVLMRSRCNWEGKKELGRGGGWLLEQGVAGSK